jgi:hypothetical protein
MGGDRNPALKSHKFSHLLLLFTVLASGYFSSISDTNVFILDSANLIVSLSNQIQKSRCRINPDGDSAYNRQQRRLLLAIHFIALTKQAPRRSRTLVCFSPEKTPLKSVYPVETLF